MVLVALAMVAIVAMAALSIDVITLYLAREEAQRSADGAALAAARVISLSGLTGDPTNSTSNWSVICDGSTSAATEAARAVVRQNTVAGSAVGTVNVTYSAGNGSSISSPTTNCSTLALSTAFGSNPIVTVQIQQTSLPSFFSRIWGTTANSVSATATAEAYNPSNSANVGNQVSGTITPVQPRCVKPFVVPNLDPWNPAPGRGPSYCAPGTCQPLVNTTDGSIVHPGISLNGTATNGVIGETLWLELDCHRRGSSCSLESQPQANSPAGGHSQPNPNLLYVPGQVGNTVTGIPACAVTEYEQAIAGCDAPTNYQCGVQNANVIDLTQNPEGSGDAANGVQCLIQQSDTANTISSSGQDYFGNGSGVASFGAPGSYPFQILAGSDTPLGTAGLKNAAVSSSPSIVSLPIYDQTAGSLVSDRTNTVTFVGFLQVFINAVDQNGNINVTVLNVAGCGNGGSTPNPAVYGSSPVPVRLVTPP